MKRNSDNLQAINDLSNDIDLLDDELDSVIEELETEERENAALKDKMDGEIFVALNELAEEIDTSLIGAREACEIKGSTLKEMRQNFIKIAEDALGRGEDPFLGLFFLMPGGIKFAGIKKRMGLNDQKSFWESMGGERAMLLDARVDSDNNRLVIHVVLELSEIPDYLRIELDFTDYNLLNNFADNETSEPDAAILVALMRFFEGKEYGLAADDFQEKVRLNDPDLVIGNVILEAILKVKAITNKYADLENRKRFSKLYAKQGVEQW